MKVFLLLAGAVLMSAVAALTAWPGANEGACCIPGSTCRYVQTEAACTALGGVFLGLNTTCGPNGQGGCGSDRWGACCTGTACVVTEATACATGAVWTSQHPCVPNPCPALGACCSADTRVCVVAFSGDCRPPWQWFPAGVTCNPNTCPQTSPLDEVTWGRIKSLYR
jgi:hypothetical protein